VSLQQLSLWNPRARKVVTPTNTSLSDAIVSYTGTVSRTVDVTSLYLGSDGRGTIYTYTTPKTALYLIHSLALTWMSFYGAEIYVDNVLKASGSTTLNGTYTYYAKVWYAAILPKGASIAVKLYGTANNYLGIGWYYAQVYTIP
jgi:hypothetical protein